MKTENLKVDLIKNLSLCRQTFKRQEPVWLTDFRQQHWDEFLRQGIPDTRAEEWKYTGLAPLSQQSFSLATRSLNPVLPDTSGLQFSGEDIVCYLINGFVVRPSGQSTMLPPGLKITSADNACQDNQQFRQELTSAPEIKDNPFILLNDALWQDYLEIKINDKTIIPGIIHIIHMTQDRPSPTLSNPRISISVGRSAQATVMLTFLSATPEPVNWTNAVVNIHIEEGAICHFIESQNENRQAFHFGALRIRQNRDSDFHSCLSTTGGALTRNDLLVELQGEGASTDLRGIYSITDHQHVDNHTQVKHLFPHGTSNQLYKGVLAQAAHAVFNGKIWVSPTAQGTNSYQLNKNLLLGEKSLVHTKPQLEIFTDDVKCTHGATIGQLNDEEILYLQMRGIGRKDAIRMLTEGFVVDVLSSIKVETARRRLQENLRPTITAAVNEKA